MLKNNLLDKVFEALTFDKHITNTSQFNEYDIAVFTLKKKLLVFKILQRALNQGKTEALYELLNRIIDSAKEYEAYDILTEALIAKKYLKGIRHGIQEFDKINEEIIFYDYCTKAVFYAIDCYYRLILNNDFVKTLSQKELDKHFQSSIQQMEIDYKKTKSQQIDYYLYILRFALCERKKDYLKAIEYCNKLLPIIKKGKVIYRDERMGFALDNLCHFYTHIGNYEAAAETAKKAQGYYIENSFNYFISKEQEFYAHMYNNDGQQALSCTEKLMDQDLVDTGEFRKSKYVYYQSCVLFSSKNFKAALDILKISLEIEKDKTRWNVSLRILNIMLYIELNKIDEAGRSLESLRKYMERATKSDEIKSRDILIVKVLRELEKDSFEFTLKNNSIEKMRQELSEKNTPVSWEHYSAELIPFHKWLEGKKR
ncbi:MAG: hypothetical protein H0W84_11890 [Bacteroidetes bacterium]|nr:hypothetical protein [Bacteroidota bacterium]